MNFTTWTNEQLRARLEELRSIGEQPGERTTEELETLAQERADIDAEMEKRRKAAAANALRRQQVANGGAGVHTLEVLNGNTEDRSTQEEEEARAKQFLADKRTEIPTEETRALLVSSGNVATPTKVSGIHDMVGGGTSTILDLVTVENCEGMGANRVAYVDSEAEAAEDQPEGEEATEKEGKFAYVDITPTSIACRAQISNQVKKQSPTDYMGKVNRMAVLSLRKKAVKKIVEAMQKSNLVAEVTAENKIDATTLRKIALSYGGENDVAGGAVLFLNKKDLIAFGDIRGTNEKKAVYEITPDSAAPNTGIIKDGGLSVRYCLVSELTALAGTEQTGEKQRTMFYGNPRCFELDLFSPYRVRVSEDFAITKLMDTIVGDAQIGGDVVVKNGFIAMTLAANE